MSQNYGNHRRFVAPYHFVAGPIFVLNLGWAISRLVKDQSNANILSLLVAIALVILFLMSRLFTLTVQDRVIRLEMQLRMASVLPAEMRSRIPEFTRDQMVALRFASDAELPALAHKVLDEKINDRNIIKKQIKNWRADDLRA